MPFVQDTESNNARHIDVSSSAYDEGQHIGVGNSNINIGSKFFKTMDPNFHQAPAEDFDDSDDIVRDITEEDERKADAESAYAYYMKMSRDGKPRAEHPAAAVSAPTSQGVTSGLVTPFSDLSRLGVGNVASTPISEGVEGANLLSGFGDNVGGENHQQQHIGRPIGSPTDMLISKRGSVTSELSSENLNFRTTNQTSSGLKYSEKVGQKRGPKATKKKVAASKKRSQSIDDKTMMKTKSIQSVDSITANGQLDQIRSQKNQSESKTVESVQSKSTIGNSKREKNQSESTSQKRNNKEILEVVDLSRSPASFFGNNSNSFVEKDDLILSYAKRYRNTGRLVADFSNGPKNAKLLVYDLNFERTRQHEEKRKRDAILGSPQPQRGRSHDDLIRETIELISKRSRLLHGASSPHEEMVDVKAEKRMIGKTLFLFFSSVSQSSNLSTNKI